MHEWIIETEKRTEQADRHTTIARSTQLIDRLFFAAFARQRTTAWLPGKRAINVWQGPRWLPNVKDYSLRFKEVVVSRPSIQLGQKRSTERKESGCWSCSHLHFSLSKTIRQAVKTSCAEEETYNTIEYTQGCGIVCAFVFNPLEFEDIRRTQSISRSQICLVELYPLLSDSSTKSHHTDR